MPIQQKRRITVTFRNAVLDYKNFAGAKKQFNNEGDRNFVIVLEEDQALQLQQDVNQYGDTWNIKPYREKYRDPNDPPLYQMKVAVKFGDYPPSCWLISSGGKVKLPEALVEMFDKLYATKIDLTVAAHDWKIDSSGQHGRKAYLENIYFHMYENELDLEYREVPDLGAIENSVPKEIESGSRQQYDYDAEVVEEL